MKRTISAMVGQGSVNHNSRAFNAKNTDRSRSHLNITYCHENIKTVFHELFDEALKRYNDKQTRGDTEWSQWVRSEKEQLAAVMERHGIEWEDKGTHDKHLSVMDYKKEQRAKEIAELEAVKAEKQGQVERQEQRLKELAPAVRNMEQLAAQFSDDPERILPEPGPLESAKSYREKKAKPLLAQIVKVLRSLYRAYVELKRKYERLQGDYGRAREGNERLSDRLQETKLENKALRGAVADFERVKRAFGPEEVERAVEDAKRREAQEREQKKAKRRFRRGAR